jgi:3-methylfumaryl-CoA hydratase
MADGAWQDWVGRSQTLRDTVAAFPARALALTLNHANGQALTEGDVLPAIWTWMNFLPLSLMSEVDPDGHPRRGGFLPPIDLPRRMWAGSRCAFEAPVRIGDSIERTSTITKIVEKSGAAGPMVLLTMAHEVRANGVVAMREEQDLAFIAIAERFTPPAPVPLPPCDWREAIAIDPVMLFRFSALTFNGHRIHYDRSYATEVERYPGLVVHGPLQAILLFDAALRRGPKGARPAHLQFRGMRPLFDFDAITLNGRTDENGELHLYTANGEDLIGMQARVRWTTA